VRPSTLRQAPREAFVKPHGRESWNLRRWGIAWRGLCVAFAIHIVDEAVNDFLSVYNPMAQSIRRQFSWIPLPTFTFAGWVILLAVALVILFGLTMFAFRGKSFMRPLSYIFSAVMLGNGLLHIFGSLLKFTPLPGVVSSPVLLAAAAYLLVAVPRDALPNPAFKRDAVKRAP
jgi:hypothetical protein